MMQVGFVHVFWWIWIQHKQLQSLFAVGNNCAHPKEAVRFEDVEILIRDGKLLASVVL